jgi:CubicO group peptidase (beta-lactamase class C family)
VDLTGWGERLEELVRGDRVPGASLAALAGGEVTALASGVLHKGTGVEATIDSLFQIGSITKVHTATVLQRLVDQGLASVDTRVVEVLPDFRVADPEVTRQVTLRHLLCHSSGINGDFFHDTGRGDDCVARYVQACADLTQVHPLGATMSYCNSGFVVLGRVIERLTGKVWDAALAEDLVAPLGLTHTWTLPEDVLRFRAAMGHVTGPDDGDLEPAPAWGLMRSAGPAGLICASASDVVAFARLHLDGGRAPDGGSLLTPPRIAEMQQPQVEVPNPHGVGQAGHWGLGWALFDWAGRRVYGHDGSTIGQSAYLRVVPDAEVVVALLTNSDGEVSRALAEAVLTELLGELCGLAVPPAPQPPADPPRVDLGRFTGIYERVGIRLEVSLHRGRLRMHVEETGELADPPFDMDLVPLDGDVVLGRPPGASQWMPVRLYSLPDGAQYLHAWARATPRVR